MNNSGVDSETITLTYIPNTDTYYFTNTYTYVQRYLFAYADEQYLASMIGIGHWSKSKQRRLFAQLSLIPDSNIMTISY